MKKHFKKIILFMLAAALCGALLTSCEVNAATPAEDTSMEQTKGNFGEGAPPDMQTGEMPKGDIPTGAAEATDVEEVLSENQSQIYGKVTSVIGNEVVLALGSYGGGSSTKDANSASGTESTEKRGGKPSNDTASGDSTPAALPEGAPSVSGADTEKTGSTPEKTGDSADSSNTSERSDASDAVEAPNASAGNNTTSSGSSKGQGQRGAGNTFSESGVTQTVQIPVGMTLTGSGSGSRSQDYSSITTGMILRITLEKQEDGSELIVAARIMSR